MPTPRPRTGDWRSSTATGGEPVYASTDEQEYWAEGAGPGSTALNRTTPAGWPCADVKQKDAELAALLAEIYGDGPWRYVKTTARKADGTPLRPQEELDHLAGLDALRSRFPVYNVNNSPRVIGMGQQDAARPGGP